MNTQRMDALFAGTQLSYMTRHASAGDVNELLVLKTNENQRSNVMGSVNSLTSLTSGQEDAQKHNLKKNIVKARANKKSMLMKTTDNNYIHNILTQQDIIRNHK
jgi:hypothetical protein